MKLFDEGIQVFEGTEFFVLAFGVLLGFVLGGFGLGDRDICSSFHNVTILMIAGDFVTIGGFPMVNESQIS